MCVCVCVCVCIYLGPTLRARCDYVLAVFSRFEVIVFFHD